MFSRGSRRGYRHRQGSEHRTWFLRRVADWSGHTRTTRKRPPHVPLFLQLRLSLDLNTHQHPRGPALARIHARGTQPQHSCFLARALLPQLIPRLIHLALTPLGQVRELNRHVAQSVVVVPAVLVHHVHPQL